MATQPADWTPVLVRPSREGARARTEPLRITLPEGLPPETVDRLAVELDALDVTGLLSREGRDLVLVPPAPLAWGEHRLRLVESAPDGSVIERGVWQLEVRRSAWFREAALEWSVTLDGSRRLTYDPPDDAAAAGPARDRNQAQATARPRGSVAGAGWEASASGDFLYLSEPPATGAERPAGDRELDVGLFLGSARAGPFAVSAGHDAIAADSLVLQNFNRRGLSASLRSLPLDASVTGFAMRTEPITGFRDGLGVGDSRHRTAGAVVSATPVASTPLLLQLSAVYLTGEGSDQTGTAVGGDPTPTAGDAWSAAADALLFDRRLRVRGEYAGTRFDFDGPEGALAREGDRAHAVLAAVTPVRRLGGEGRPLTWDVGAEWLRIGTFFRSPANPGAPADRDLVRAFTTLDWGGLDLRVSAGREHSNVNDLALVPRIRTDQAAVAVNYRPLPPSGDGTRGWRRWLGQPGLALSLLEARRTQVATPAAFEGPEVDLRTRTVQVSASFAYDAWDWSVSQSLGWQDDFAGTSPDTRDLLTGVGVNVRAGSRLSLAPRLQWGETDAFDTGVRTTRLLAGITVEAALVPDRLTARVAYDLNRERASDDSVDTTRHTASGGLTWQVLQARGWCPGIALWLRGDLQEATDGTTGDSYQGFLGTTLSWAAGF